jgi:plasmid maintenance system antidote protein VapI
MEYSFELVGVSPVLSFFKHQQAVQRRQHTGAEYLAAYRCTLDALIESVEEMPPRNNWNLDRVVDTVINFWLNNNEKVSHWKKRLEDAGSDNLLVARVADLDSLKIEFETLLKPES